MQKDLKNNIHTNTVNTLSKHNQFIGLFYFWALGLLLISFLGFSGCGGGTDAALLTRANALGANIAHAGNEIISSERYIKEAVEKTNINLKKIQLAQKVQYFGERQSYVDSVLYLYKKEVEVIQKSGNKLEKVFDKYIEVRKKYNEFLQELESGKHSPSTTQTLLNAFDKRRTVLQDEHKKQIKEFNAHIPPHNNLIELLDFQFVNLHGEKISLQEKL